MLGRSLATPFNQRPRYLKCTAVRVGRYGREYRLEDPGCEIDSPRSRMPRLRRFVAWMTILFEQISPPSQCTTLTRRVIIKSSYSKKIGCFWTSVPLSLEIGSNLTLVNDRSGFANSRACPSCVKLPSHSAIVWKLLGTNMKSLRLLSCVREDQRHVCSGFSWVCRKCLHNLPDPSCRLFSVELAFGRIRKGQGRTVADWLR